MSENTKDAFEMTEEEFQAEEARLLNIEEPEDEKPFVPEEILAQPDEEEPPKEPPAEEPPEDEPEPFRLEGEPEEDYTDYELVHNGQKITKKLNKQGLTNELQKAHNYDSKMEKITPYINMTNAIMKNPELANVVRTYLTTGKMPEAQKAEDFKFKSISEYEGEDAADKWFKDNMDGFRNAILAGQKPETPQIPEPSQMPNNVVPFNIGGKKVDMSLQDAFVMTSLQSRDPENFQQVLPAMSQVIGTLSQAQQDQINNETANGDYKNLFKLYDYAKQQIKPPAPPAKKTFRMKSNTTENKNSTQTKDPWNYTPKEFNKIVNAVLNH